MNSIADVFDNLCFSIGDHDAIIGSSGFVAVGYTEIQQSSYFLAYQLLHRFRPTYVLLDLRNAVAAEAVSILACMRIGVPFVPVSAEELHVGDRLGSIIKTLRGETESSSSSSRKQIVAVVRCDDDRDPILSKFEAVNVHSIIYVNDNGEVLEPMDVPNTLPTFANVRDDLYVLFTSGTSNPSKPKAVVGSHSSTIHRLKWFAEKFPFCDDGSAANDTVVARRSKLTFVDGITELLSGLLFPPGVLYTFDQKELATQGIAAILTSPCTRLTLLPSQLSQLLMLLSQSEDSALKESELRTVIVSGEPCSPSIVMQFRNHFPKAKLINLYGQTESTGDVLCAELTSMTNPVVDNVCAVGWPIPNVAVSLSPNNELIIKGNLSNGYLNSDPFDSLYTGDVGFSTADGCFYVKGRMDDICKINGVLTSPSEVEAAFAKAYNIPCCAVILDGAVYVLAEMIGDGKHSFSREAMKSAGTPWNLIPKLVFFSQSCLPRSTTGGAGKIDRTRVRAIVEDLLINQSKPKKEAQRDDLINNIVEVLGIPVVDESSSFVDLGGDSALAVTLLYKLRKLSEMFGNTLTAADILEADSIKEIRSLLTSEEANRRRPKKPKLDLSPTFKFEQRVERLTEAHVTVSFKACVDASPIVNGMNVFGACQGGVIQRVCCDTHVSVSAFHELLGWSIQGDIIVHGEDTIIVCGYQATEEMGIVVALSLELCTVRWKKLLKGKIKSTPLTVDGHIYVLAGSTLHAINPANIDEESPCIELPSESQSKPALVSSPRGGRQLVYAFSDWEMGLAVVKGLGDSDKMELTIIEGITSPAYADLLAIDEARVIVADISGYVHEVNIHDRTVLKSMKMSDKPIFSGPVLLPDGGMVFGCHDGIVRCVHVSNMEKIRWQYSTQAVVYAKTLPIVEAKSEGSGFVVVCTTAGDVMVVNSSDGREIVKYTVDGEIWSNPTYLTTSLGKRCVIVGARDSKIHVITLCEPL